MKKKQTKKNNQMYQWWFPIPSQKQTAQLYKIKSLHSLSLGSEDLQYGCQRLGDTTESFYAKCNSSNWAKGAQIYYLVAEMSEYTVWHFIMKECWWSICYYYKDSEMISSSFLFHSLQKCWLSPCIQRLLSLVIKSFCAQLTVM